jgi:hypothetical protein
MSANLHVITNLDDDRQKLSDAIATRNEARETVSRAEAVLSRSADNVAILSADVDALADDIERATTEQATAMREALIGGYDAPRAASTTLGDATARKHEARAQLDAARQCHMSLSKEYDDAQAHLALCQKNVEHLARIIVGMAGDALVKELAIAEKSCAQARARLLGITAIKPGEPFRVSQASLMFLCASPENARVANSAVDREFWSAFLLRLTEDANATADDTI